VHFFSLDDFAGHEIQTILEDGAEGEHETIPEPSGPDDSASVGGQSVRPGSMISNIEQRLDDIEGFHGDPDADTDQSDGNSGAGSSSAHAAMTMYGNLLQQMQVHAMLHRRTIAIKNPSPPAAPLLAPADALQLHSCLLLYASKRFCTARMAYAVALPFLSIEILLKRISSCSCSWKCKRSLLATHVLEVQGASHRCLAAQ